MTYNPEGVSIRYGEIKEEISRHCQLSDEAIASLVVADVLQGIAFDLEWLVGAVAKLNDMDPSILPE